MKESVAKAIDLLRSRVPMALLPLLIELRFRIAWSRSAVRADARQQMAFLLERSNPDADLDAAARAYVRTQVWRGEIRWHPEGITRLRVVGMEHMRSAQALGRGVILNFMHHGSYEGGLSSIGRLGAPAQMIVYPYMVREDAPRWLKQHMLVACLGGGTPVSAEIGNAGIASLLTEGKVVAIASDVPGRTPLRFAGRDVLGSFGAARLATTTGSPVIVMTYEKDDQGHFVRVHEPLHPEDFESPQPLLAEMVSRHERAILAWPEATDLPLSRWGTAASEAAAA